MFRSKRTTYTRQALVLAAGLVLFAGPAFGIRCKEEPPIPGDTLQAVEKKCGSPTLKEQRMKTVKEVDAEGTRSTSTNIVEYTYDSGPQELLQTYRFENGALVDILGAGYGRPHDDRGDTCRNGELLAVGDTPVDAYLKCGEPLARENRPNKITETEENGTKRTTTITVTEWTYRYGRDLPGYSLTFEEGMVTDIRPREFGK